MRNYLPRWLTATLLVTASSCTQIDNIEDEYPGYVAINEELWRFDHSALYPFTANGELSCEDHPLVGKAVFFNPENYTNEFYVGTPLNDSAQRLINLIDVESNVPYTIKDNADLREINALGESLCDRK